MNRRFVFRVVVTVLACAALGVIGILVATSGYFFLQGEYYRSPGMTFQEFSKPQASLMDSFKSYETVVRTLRSLREQSAQFEIEEDRQVGHSTLPLARGVSYHEVTITVPGFVHLGVIGKLKLRFFNDRLMSTSFFPSEPGKYIEKLGLVGVDLRDRGPRMIGEYTRVGVAESREDGVSVWWEDTRLREEERLWRVRYW